MIPEVLVKRLKKVPYEEAVETVELLTADRDCTPEMKGEYEAFLATLNGKAGTNGHATPSGAKPSKAERRKAILTRWKAGEIDDATQEKELALLEGEVDLATILNLDVIASYPTRSLGQKGNSGWFFHGPVELPDGRTAKVVSLNILLTTDR